MRACCKLGSSVCVTALALEGYPQSTPPYAVLHNNPPARATNAEIENIVDRHPKLAECCHHFNNTRDVSPSLLTALYYIPAHLLKESGHATDLLNAMRATPHLRSARGCVAALPSGAFHSRQAYRPDLPRKITK